MTAEFWDYPAMRDALRNRHLGQIIRAWRTHPQHGRQAVSQSLVAAWMGITQAQLSRIETGGPVVHLDRLIEWAKALRIPPHLLWFTLPTNDSSDSPEAPSGSELHDPDRTAHAETRYPDHDRHQALRSKVLNYRWDGPAEPMPLTQVEATVHAANLAYQAADYGFLDRLPEVAASTASLITGSSGADLRRGYKALAWTYLILSKFGAKVGDGELAWITADRAATWAMHLQDQAVSGVAAYQTACAMAKNGRPHDAQEVALVAAEALAVHPRHAHPHYLSVQGALLLHAAVMAARLRQRDDAQQRLDAAERLADDLGGDRNEMWTAFGPTNVALHRLSVAAALGDHHDAVDLGNRIDTTRLPPALVSRRAQVHLDLAAVHSQRPNGDPQALLHLMEGERIAPQAIRHNADARHLIAALLKRARRGDTPGLLALAQRAGVAA
ncbi:helix-turn-helix domain-containing protein [Polymorphospora lycopeni]|uniref:Helix-turn-helix transcriptional regulator n=1 Tax=Polymorphospora lycopeni TaxID=3140240 RepID=A0ABV5CNF0_9ACTN